MESESITTFSKHMTVWVLWRIEAESVQLEVATLLLVNVANEWD